MPTATATKPGTRRLSEVARHLVRPDGIVGTEWPAVRAKCEHLGLGFDTWQDGAGRLILAKREGGLYAAGIGGVVISIPRQVGKTYLIGAIVFALCLLHPGLTVIWTAHQLKTAKETFLAMQAMARRKKVRSHVLRVVLGSGDEAVMFRNGSRIMFGARERGFGLGFAGVDVLVLDEAQRVTQRTMDDMVPALNVSPNPLLLMLGTPPRPTDVGDVFRSVRREAVAGESEDTLYIEVGADPDTKPGAVDWVQLAKANPSYPHRTSKASILRMWKRLGEDSFRREGYGIWDDDGAPSEGIDQAEWASCFDPKSTAKDGPRAFGVAQSPDRSMVSIAALVQRPDGQYHGELIEHRKASAGWAARRVRELREAHSPVAVIVDPIAAGIVRELETDDQVLGEDFDIVKTVDYMAACGRLFDLVHSTAQGSDDGALEFHHADQPHLRAAVESAILKRLARGVVWRQGGDAPISPLVAVTLALVGFESVDANYDPVAQIF